MAETKWPGDECPPDCRYSMKMSSTGHGDPHRHCGFILYEGQIRGCEPGKGCARYRAGRRPVPVKWDTARGRQMWLSGRSNSEIARELGVCKATVQNRKARFWKKNMD